MTLHRFALPLLPLVLAGCMTVGPDYRAEPVVHPQAWHGATDPGDGAARMRQWWQAFDDPALTQLVDQALAANQDLGIAREHLRAARAERDRIASRSGPTIGVGATGEALRSSEVLDWPPGIGQSRTFSTGFDAQWELDIFGGTRRAIEAAGADSEAVAFEADAIRISLLAELAADYVALRTTQLRLKVAQENVRNLQAGEAITREALRKGLGTSLEIAQAQAERELAEAQLPTLDAQIEVIAHALGVLTGGYPGDVLRLAQDDTSRLPAPPTLPLALPSEVLAQRPDLRADERRLAAANARIGVATAERYPHFSIPLTLGTTASVLGDLFSGASLAWSVALSAQHTLYDGGRANAGVTIAQADAQAQRLIYERDVRRAFRDVEDALSRLNAERRRADALAAAVADSTQALARSERLYLRGLTGYLPVLAAQRVAFRARDAQVLGQATQLRDSIALYKALGTGWADTTTISSPPDAAALQDAVSLPATHGAAS